MGNKDKNKVKKDKEKNQKSASTIHDSHKKEENTYVADPTILRKKPINNLTESKTNEKKLDAQILSKEDHKDSEELISAKNKNDSNIYENVESNNDRGTNISHNQTNADTVEMCISTGSGYYENVRFSEQEQLNDRQQSIEKLQEIYSKDPNFVEFNTFDVSKSGGHFILNIGVQCYIPQNSINHENLDLSVAQFNYFSKENEIYGKCQSMKKWALLGDIYEFQPHCYQFNENVTIKIPLKNQPKNNREVALWYGKNEETKVKEWILYSDESPKDQSDEELSWCIIQNYCYIMLNHFCQFCVQEACDDDFQTEGNDHVDEEENAPENDHAGETTAENDGNDQNAGETTPENDGNDQNAGETYPEKNDSAGEAASLNNHKASTPENGGNDQDGNNCKIQDDDEGGQSSCPSSQCQNHASDHTTNDNKCQDLPKTNDLTTSSKDNPVNNHDRNNPVNSKHSTEHNLTPHTCTNNLNKNSAKTVIPRDLNISDNGPQSNENNDASTSDVETATNDVTTNKAKEGCTNPGYLDETKNTTSTSRISTTNTSRFSSRATSRNYLKIKYALLYVLPKWDSNNTLCFTFKLQLSSQNDEEIEDEQGDEFKIIKESWSKPVASVQLGSDFLKATAKFSLETTSFILQERINEKEIHLEQPSETFCITENGLDPEERLKISICLNKTRTSVWFPCFKERAIPLGTLSWEMSCEKLNELKKEYIKRRNTYVTQTNGDSEVTNNDSDGTNNDADGQYESIGIVQIVHVQHPFRITPNPIVKDISDAFRQGITFEVCNGIRQLLHRGKIQIHDLMKVLEVEKSYKIHVELIIQSLPMQDDLKVFNELFHFLKECNCDDVANKLQFEIEKENIRLKLEYIAQDIQMGALKVALYSNNIINDEEKQIISSKNTDRERALFLLENKILKGNKDIFTKFVKCLITTEQKHIVERFLIFPIELSLEYGDCEDIVL